MRGLTHRESLSVLKVSAAKPLKATKLNCVYPTVTTGRCRDGHHAIQVHDQDEFIDESEAWIGGLVNFAQREKRFAGNRRSLDEEIASRIEVTRNGFGWDFERWWEKLLRRFVCVVSLTARRFVEMSYQKKKSLQNGASSAVHDYKGWYFRASHVGSKFIFEFLFQQTMSTRSALWKMELDWDSPLTVAMTRLQATSLWLSRKSSWVSSWKKRRRFFHFLRKFIKFRKFFRWISWANVEPQSRRWDPRNQQQVDCKADADRGLEHDQAAAARRSRSADD